MLILIFLSVLLQNGYIICYTKMFPEDFNFAVATASYQVEGGWNADGKGENIWDRFTHNHADLITDHSTGDVACDSYHLWEQDINMLENLGVDFYRFSISWSRILPTGFPNIMNNAGIKYYDNLINKLIERKIKPIVTLYHWDLPQSIQDLGGWPNPKTSEYFKEYARIVFKLFGDRVKVWITINEPYSVCEDTYGNGNGAPFVNSSGIGDYLCGRTLLLAHAKAYHVYKEEFKSTQKGMVGITIDSIWAEPKTNNTADIEAADRQLQMSFGWWAHPIFSNDGDYPEVMKQRISYRSSLENFVTSRLPPFTPNEIQLLKGSADFLGLNHYHTYLMSNLDYPIGEPSYEKDKGTQGSQDPNWKPSINIVPWGFRKLLNWVKTEYNNPLVLITENGYPDKGQLNDTDRITFIKNYMKAVLESVIVDKCNVKLYTFWSLMDNMEWTSGYTIKFGLYQVDFSSPNRTRTPKRSADVFKTIIKTRTIPN